MVAKTSIKSRKVSSTQAKSIRHRSFRLTRHSVIKTSKKPVRQLSFWQLLSGTGSLLWQGKLVLGQVVLVHLILLLILAPGPGSESSQVYISLLLIIMSMAEIWLVRRLSAQEPTSFKAAVFEGTTQVVPFSLVTFLFALQLLPFIVGLWLFQIVVVGQIAIHLSEKTIFIIIWLSLALLSWYWVAASLFALYIVTLPGVTPMQAWQKAKPLVEGRRSWLLLRVVYASILLSLIGYGLVLIIPSSWLAGYNILALVVALLLPIWHTYMYKLYRALV